LGDRVAVESAQVLEGVVAGAVRYVGVVFGAGVKGFWSEGVHCSCGGILPSKFSL